MIKEKKYKRVKFSSEKIKEAISKLNEKLPEIKHDMNTREVNFKNESWSHDNDEEFFADFQKEYVDALFSKTIWGKEGEIYTLRINSTPLYETSVSIEAPKRSEIENIFYVFDKDYKKFEIELDEDDDQPIIFIGHGRSMQWRDLKDHLSDKHGFGVEAYESGARAGHTIRDILDEMMVNSSFAILVLTGEDKLEDGKMLARPNVIHETGLFQGKLGFSRAIILLEEGTEEFSNLHGIQQIRFSKNNIKETFGEILATLKREFK